MSVDVIRTGDSREDLNRILAYFLDENESAVGTRFLDAYEMTLSFISDFPELGSPWESLEPCLKDVRVKLIVGFEKYLVFYRVSARGVYILHVFHGHQDIDHLL